MLESKVWRARWALVLEQLWLRLWILFAIAGLFILVSYAGIWPLLGDLAHIALLTLFGAGTIAAIVHMIRVPWPSRDEAIRRIERVSGVAHRPASSYEDTLSVSGSDPATLVLWQAHRERMAALLKRLKAGKPRPRTDRLDPFAVRAILVLLVVLLTALAGDRIFERLGSAFHLGSSVRLAEARLDAWVTPPTYTGRPPLMLADGATPVGQAAAQAGDPAEVPQKSVLIVRSGGMGSARLAIEVSTAGAAAPQRIEPAGAANTHDVQEVRYELQRASTVRVFGGRTQLAEWHINVTPDKLPVITLLKPPEVTPRGSMKLTYKIEDDYGLASAAVKLEKAKQRAADPGKEWARPEPPKGPRPPLLRPPALPLTLPKPGAPAQEGVLEGQAHSYLEVASHPWAGLKVVMTLEAKDVAGQTGHSQSLEMILPERQFTKPLARAVIEQRRKLLDDPRYREQVVTALDALTIEPETFIEDLRVYLGLRTVAYRLINDRSRAGMKSSIEQLWHIALRIEDGSLSDAERALKDAQERLAKALENGASDEEIKKLMQELRQSLDEYMKQLAQQGGEDGQQPNGQDQQNQSLSQDDLERMMKNLEDMAKSGAREQAQQLLSEMRDLMERMQSGRMDEAQAKKNQEMMQMMDELGDMVGEQQKLMDDTFEEQREGGQQGEGQKPPPGMKGMGSEEGDGKQGGAPPGMGQRPKQGRGQQRGQQGQGQAHQGQGDQLGQGQEGQEGLSQLRERQRELKERLGKLQKEMREKGGSSSQQLDSARDAMESAEQALDQGDLVQATEEQSRALEQMRQGAQSMAQEMLRNMPQRYGQSGDTPRDPLGRPQRSQGPDLGTSVKVPDQIDIQRAREILEELRRRLGEATRGPTELDYLERLLTRF
jgi:uncharacterized protein (TIGR02302 family)